MKRKKGIPALKILLLVMFLAGIVGIRTKSCDNVSAKDKSGEFENPKSTVEKLELDSAVEAEENVEEQEALSAYQLENFPIISQYPEVPTGCEITALTMVLNYYGYQVDKETMAESYLPKIEYSTYYGDDGRLYGNDLNRFFIGNPFSAEEGTVCGIPALVTAADQYLQQAEGTLRAQDISGTSSEELYKLIAEGKPVVVLVTIGMGDRWSTQGWYTENGDYVEWSQNDHGAVLIGYTETTVTIADPIAGMMEYPRERFESVYLSRGQKSLILNENI